MFEKLAEELRTARDKAGLTKEQVATKIRMDVNWLGQMEDGDFTFMAEVYIKAFLRDYAKTVDLDPELIMKKFKAAKEGKEYEFNAVPEKPAEKPVQKVYSIDDAGVQPVMAEPGRPSLDIRQLLLIGGMAVVVIFIAVYYFFFRSNDDIIVTERPVETQLQEKEKPRFETPAPAVNQATTDSMTLSFVSATTPCWISITVDESANGKRETFLQPNSTYSVKGKKNFTVILGDKTGIAIKLNEKPLSFTSSQKRVSLFIDSLQVREL